MGGEKTAEASLERRKGPEPHGQRPPPSDPQEEAEASSEAPQNPWPLSVKNAGKKSEAGSLGRARSPMLSKQNQEVEAHIQVPDYKCPLTGTHLDSPHSILGLFKNLPLGIEESASLLLVVRPSTVFSIRGQTNHRVRKCPSLRDCQ